MRGHFVFYTKLHVPVSCGNPRACVQTTDGRNVGNQFFGFLYFQWVFYLNSFNTIHPLLNNSKRLQHLYKFDWILLQLNLRQILVILVYKTCIQPSCCEKEMIVFQIKLYSYTICLSKLNWIDIHESIKPRPPGDLHPIQFLGHSKAIESECGRGVYHS